MSYLSIKSTIALGLFITVFGCQNKENIIRESEPGNTVSIKAPTGTGTQWYVAANGSASNDGLAPSRPKNNLRDVAALTMPGDVVNIMSSGGVFKRIGQSGTVLSTTVSGLPGQEITFRGYPVGGTKPIIVGYSIFNTVSLSNVSYINIENIEVRGDKAGTYGGPVLTQGGANTVATNTRNYYVGNGNSLTGYAWTDPQIAYQTSGIFITGKSHHVNVRNCYIHDLPGAGIATKDADYLTIEDNTVTNCASYAVYGMSGISFLVPFNYDGHSGTDYEMIIRRNKCYYNKSTTNYYITGALSDGNGIIVDINTRDVNGNSGNPYLGKTLVENNISYSNGGGGVHVVTAQNVDVRNNTCYNNGLVVGYAEMDASYGSKNVNFWSNITQAKSGGKCIDNPFGGVPNQNIVFFKNVLFNGSYTPASTLGFTNTDFRTTDPNFISDNTDFRLGAGSSAANFGSGSYQKYSPKDIVGVTRVVNVSSSKYPDCGAYESFP